MCSKYPEMVGLLGKSRDGLFPGGSPDMVGLLGKSRYGLFPGGSPDMVWLLGKSRDVTSRHI